MAERKQQNRDLTEMEVIDSGSKESAAQTVHRMRRNEEQKRNTIDLLNSKRIVDPEFNLVVVGLLNVVH